MKIKIHHPQFVYAEAQGEHEVLSPKCWTSLKFDGISIKLLQTVEDSCKNRNKKKICKYSWFGAENVKICDFFLMFKNIFQKDLLNVLMAELQTIDIYLGHTRLSFKIIILFALK